jgi:hypothetical protein
MLVELGALAEVLIAMYDLFLLFSETIEISNSF